jgi:response regulator RpfG family c-di-GMP phosphodiesterase
MRYDASGYPKTKHTIRIQHLISQLVAISDFFDALRTQRAYRPSFQLNETITVLKEASGTYFNPDLVDNFLTALYKEGIH